MKKRNQDKSRVIVFTVHKGGSMLLHRILRDICQKNNITYYSPNESPEHQLPFERIFQGEDFISDRIGCFGPLRFFVPTVALESANVLLHLRDPRDVLTSMFFSYCFMHPGEIEGNTGYRKEVAEAGVDKFVLDMCDENCMRYRGQYGTGLRFTNYVGNLRDRYNTYRREVVGRPNVTLVSYEEMVLDFPSWLRKGLAAFTLDDADETYDFLMERHGQAVKPEGQENIWAHKRKVIPGDYKEKLKPETIAELNRRFADVLEALGYSGSQYAARQIPEPAAGLLPAS